MGVVTNEVEVNSPIPPARIFKAVVLDFDNLFPKVVPHAIKKVELIEGDGGSGSIKKITFAEGSKFKYMKHKIEEVDKENFTHKYSVIEGDVLGDKIEKICYENKYTAAPGGGTICKSTSKYYTIGNNDIAEEEIKARREQANAVYKAVEEYLLANPDIYN